MIPLSNESSVAVTVCGTESWLVHVTVPPTAIVTVAGRSDAGWPPTGEGFDVLVNCTPVRDELLVVPRREQQVVDLAYLTDGRDTALVAAARAAGCATVVDGADVLLAQGAASFERWTGRTAPVAAMRAALRGA